MSESDNVRKVLSNIRSLRAFAREVDFELLKDMAQKFNAVVEELREDAEREAKEREQRDARKRELLEMIASEGFSVEELTGASDTGSTRKKRVVQQVPAKYQFEVNGEMQYWTGRGRKPKALGLGDPKIVKDYVNNVPDLDDYAAKLAESYNKLDSAGYDVINIVPINIGSSDQCFQDNKNYVGDVGYSITRGAVVVGKLREVEG
ncbi:H-NS histone family protein [Salmonella enterica]|nr:H-NS histone family protein [Salmonella enterica]